MLHLGGWNETFLELDHTTVVFDEAKHEDSDDMSALPSVPLLVVQQKRMIHG